MDIFFRNGYYIKIKKLKHGISVEFPQNVVEGLPVTKYTYTCKDDSLTFRCTNQRGKKRVIKCPPYTWDAICRLDTLFKCQLHKIGPEISKVDNPEAKATEIDKEDKEKSDALIQYLHSLIDKKTNDPPQDIHLGVEIINDLFISEGIHI